MYPLRQSKLDPSRSSHVEEKNRHNDYKKELRKDFIERCGYCSDWDRLCGGTRFYQIDHFVPQNPKEFTHDIKSNSYSNLVYACFFCNNAKRNDFPTNDPNIHHDDEKGYVDPCSSEYTTLFRRNKKGEITPITKVGTYIYRHLKFYLKRHEILWKIEQVHFLLDELDKLSIPNENEKAKELHYELLKYYRTYFKDLIYLNE